MAVSDRIEDVKERVPFVYPCPQWFQERDNLCVGAYQCEAPACVGFDKAFIDIDDVGKGGIQASGRQVLERFTLGALAHDFNTRCGKFVTGIAIVGKSALNAYPLAFEVNQWIVNDGAGLHRQFAGGVIVLFAEID